jgi:hypothetical protein
LSPSEGRFSGGTARPGAAARKALLVLGLVAAVALSAAAARKWWVAGKSPPARAEGEPAPAYQTPYVNARPGVRYLGTAACAECHPRRAISYAQHPMGRSLAPVAEATALEHYGPESRNTFESQGTRFEVERRGGRVFHKEVHRDARGKEVAAVQAEVQFALGSGRQGRSYLVDRDGYLFESPISWYSERRRWDLSPGYEKKFLSFRRGITEQCLDCHSDGADHVEHTENRYREPVFRGHAIGCERCHGPGELHVASRRRGDDPDHIDYTIVNPRDLEPALREAVCQQCHLQGEARVVRRGRSLGEYRPGLPLHRFLSTFVRPPELTEGHKSVGHVEQMSVSRCFRESGGRLGCISCHDPHVLPAPEKRAAYYRGRCLQCHEEAGCSLPLPVRREQAGDRCADCHMPPSASTNIAHTAVTDHRILRRPDQPPRLPVERRPGEIPLVYFYRELVGESGGDVARDLGVAMIETARRMESDGLARTIGSRALPLLDRAVQEAPDDLVAWEARGYALWLVGSAEGALRASETALAHAPQREVALADAGLFAAKLGRADLAVSYWRRVLEVNPWQEPPHFNIGRVLAEREDWEGVLRECRAGLQVDPTSVESRVLLVLYYAKTGRHDRARAEFESVLALKPPDEERLRSWFAGLELP